MTEIIIGTVYLPRIRQKPSGLTLLGKADDGMLKKTATTTTPMMGKGWEE